MGKPSWENLDDFMQLDTEGGFARPAVITLQSGTTLSVNGVFDDAYLNAQLGEFEHDTSAPRFTCAASAVADVERGDVLELDGKKYDIMSAPRNDGTGMATLVLEPQ